MSGTTATIGAATPSPEATRRVRPWIAALLTIPAVGLGHFYAGRTGRALAWIVGQLIGGVLFMAALHVWEDDAWLLGALAILLFVVAAVVDAFVTTNARRQVPRRRPWRLLGYVLIYALSVAIAAGLRMTPLRSFYIPSMSMLPALNVQDRMLVRMRSPLCPLEVARGDIVLVEQTFGGDRPEHLVRRVVGLAGDHVRIDAEGLEVNGDRVTGPVIENVDHRDYRGRDHKFDVAEERFEGGGSWRVYGEASGGRGPDRDIAGVWGPAYDGVVPEGHVFAIGDDRANSNDDRLNGPTPVDAIVGKPLRVAFSLGEGQDFLQWRDLRVRDAPACAAP